MGGLVWATINVLRLWVGFTSDAILLGVGFLVGFFSYLLILPLIGAIESADLENLNAVFGKIRFLAPMFNIFFTYMKRVFAMRSRS